MFDKVVTDYFDALSISTIIVGHITTLDNTSGTLEV